MKFRNFLRNKKKYFFNLKKKKKKKKKKKITFSSTTRSHNTIFILWRIFSIIFLEKK